MRLAWNRDGPFAFLSCARWYSVAASGGDGLLPQAAADGGQVAAGERLAGVLELAVKRTTVLLLEFIRRPEWLRAL
jgi:hypothetical protein